MKTANNLIEEYKPILTGDAGAIVLECVRLRIEDGIHDMQSFLPPSMRLPASHYAQFLFTEEDVERFKTEQTNIAKLLEEQLEPDYENETVVWVGDSEEPSDTEEAEDSEEDEDVEENSED